MRDKHLIHRLMVVTVVTIFAASGAQAQTKPKTPVTPTSTRAFDKLSLGNQKVASALYQAQSSGVAATSTNGTTPAGRPLTLEEIAAKRRGGQAWGQIFREMKAQGLVHEKSLGQVVGKYQRSSDASLGTVAGDNGGVKSNAFEVSSNGSAGGAAHGVGKGGK
jgi:hypothetical protein